jgi:hypothetical protein
MSREYEYITDWNTKETDSYVVKSKVVEEKEEEQNRNCISYDVYSYIPEHILSMAIDKTVDDYGEWLNATCYGCWEEDRKKPYHQMVEHVQTENKAIPPCNYLSISSLARQQLVGEYQILAVYRGDFTSGDIVENYQMYLQAAKSEDYMLKAELDVFSNGTTACNMYPALFYGEEVLGVAIDKESWRKEFYDVQDYLNWLIGWLNTEVLK